MSPDVTLTEPSEPDLTRFIRPILSGRMPERPTSLLPESYYDGLRLQLAKEKRSRRRARNLLYAP